jgi:hypothetical protein
MALVRAANDIEMVAMPIHTPVSAGLSGGPARAVQGRAAGGPPTGGCCGRVASVVTVAPRPA